MASLTPQHRSDEVVGEVMKEGLINGAMTFVPCMGALYAAMRNPNFRKFTNWQSRTALVLMPSLFVFALTAEQKMVHRMEEVAEETEHTIKSVHWAERQYQLSPEDIKLHDLYRQAVLNSGIRVVEGDQLGPFHNAANYVQANPFKVILGVGLPAVGAIFYGRVGKEHLSMQLKILHTRVFGQFAIICTLLGVMGLKATMDQQGRYVTEDEVERRVAEMQETRIKLLHRIDEVNASMPHKHVPHHHDAKEGSDDHGKSTMAHA